MASRVVQIERWHDTGMAFVRVRNSDAPETNVVRCIDYNIFRNTCIPAEHQFRAGALVSLMFGYQNRTVELIELRWFEGGPLWVADAQIDDGDQTVRRRGVGATPVDALVDLSFDIQQY